MLKIKMFDEEHEEDCMDEVNEFLCTIDEKDIIDIRFSSSHFSSGDDQIFSFTVCIIYRIEQ